MNDFSKVLIIVGLALFLSYGIDGIFVETEEPFENTNMKWICQENIEGVDAYYTGLDVCEFIEIGKYD